MKLLHRFTDQRFRGNRTRDDRDRVGLARHIESIVTIEVHSQLNNKVQKIEPDIRQEHNQIAVSNPMTNRKDVLLPISVICCGLVAWCSGVPLPPEPYLSTAGLLLTPLVLLYYSEQIAKYAIRTGLTPIPRAGVAANQRMLNAIANLGTSLILVGKLCFKHGRWTGPRTSTDGVILSINALYNCLLLLGSQTGEYR